MFTRLAIITASAVVILSVAAVPAMAQTHVSINIGHPVQRVAVAPVAVVPAQPYPGYVWQPAHYEWTAYGYQMVPGMWAPGPYAVPPAYAAPVYVAPRPVYVAPRYIAPRPVYVAPRYVAPRPVYVAPRYVAPRPVYVAPRGVAVGLRVNNGHRRHR